MSRPGAYDSPSSISILHPSDFSEASEVAFAHALKAALIARSRLTLFHVSPDMTAEWSDFPAVRQTLARWGLLPPGSPRSAVPALGIGVRKIIAHERNPVSSCSVTSTRIRPTSSCSLRISTTTHALAPHVGRRAGRAQGGAGDALRAARGGRLRLPAGRGRVTPAHSNSRGSTPNAWAALAAAARLVTRLARRPERSPAARRSRRGTCRR